MLFCLSRKGFYINIFLSNLLYFYFIFFESVKIFSPCCRFPALSLLFWCLFYYLVCCFPLYFNQHLKRMLKWSWNNILCTSLPSFFAPRKCFLYCNLKVKKKCSFDVAINTVLQYPICFYPFIKTCKCFSVCYPDVVITWIHF